MNIISTTPTARAVTDDDGLRVELSAADAMLDPAQARALAYSLIEAADLVMQAERAALADRVIHCPSWCTFDHASWTYIDETDLTPHETIIGMVEVDCGRLDRAETKTKTVALQSWERPDGSMSGPHVSLLHEGPNLLDLAQCEALAELWRKAAEALRAASA